MIQISFLDKLERELKKRRLFVDRSNTNIVYRPKVKASLLTKERRRFHIIRKGCVRIVEKGNEYLIESRIDLTGHFLLAIFTGFLFSYAIGYSFNHNILFMTISTISLATLLFITGYLKAKRQTNSIIRYIIQELS